MLVKRWVDNGEASVWHVGIIEKKYIKGWKKKDFTKKKRFTKNISGDANWINICRRKFYVDKIIYICHHLWIDIVKLQHHFLTFFLTSSLKFWCDMFEHVLYCVARCKSWINGRIAGEQAFSVLKLDETQGQSYLFMASKEKSKPSSSHI